MIINVSYYHQTREISILLREIYKNREKNYKIRTQRLDATDEILLRQFCPRSVSSRGPQNRSVHLNVYSFSRDMSHFKLAPQIPNCTLCYRGRVGTYVAPIIFYDSVRKSIVHILFECVILIIKNQKRAVESTQVYAQGV